MSGQEHILTRLKLRYLIHQLTTLWHTWQRAWNKQLLTHLAYLRKCRPARHLQTHRIIRRSLREEENPLVTAPGQREQNLFRTSRGISLVSVTQCFNTELSEIVNIWDNICFNIKGRHLQCQYLERDGSDFFPSLCSELTQKCAEKLHLLNLLKFI